MSKEKKKWSKKKKIVVITLSVILSLLVLVFAGGLVALHMYCQTADYTVISTEEEVTLVAHRGFRGVAPENTIPAFEKAGEAKFWGAECDTYRTADGVWVITHDPIDYRMTGKIFNMEKKSYNELMELNITNGVDIESYPELKYCTLEEYLAVCKQYNMVAVIELKGKNNTEHYDEIMELVDKAGVEAVFISFHFENLEKIRALTDAPVYFLVQKISEDDIELAKTIPNCGIDFNGMKDANFKTDIIKQCKDAGLEVGAWTIDDQESLDRLIEYGVTLITTDCITY